MAGGFNGGWNNGWGQSNGSAPPVTLNGDWEVFNRCPVDNSTMLAADGVKNIALCTTLTSASGVVSIGNLTLPTGEANAQFGLISHSNEGGETTFTPIGPRGGSLIAAPIEIPDGLPTLICPSYSWNTRWICRKRRDGSGNNELNNVTVTVQSAGEPTEFNLFGALGSGTSLASLPVKVHVQNPVLGPNCYIGTESDPIVLQVSMETETASGAFEGFETNGTALPSTENAPLQRIAVTGSTYGDSAFAVPAASGCGFRGQLDANINRNAGLPSPSGKNTFQMNDTSIYIGGLSNPGEASGNDGQDLSTDWHSAVEEEEGNDHHGHHHHHH